jgi:hypothetical protein
VSYRPRRGGDPHQDLVGGDLRLRNIEGLERPAVLGNSTGAYGCVLFR